MHTSIEIANDHQALQEQQTNQSISNIIMTMNSPINNSNNDDAFDGSAEPIIYMSDNRMPVMIEFNSAIIYIVFAALILALLFILPGVRKTKITSLLGMLTLLTVGASILLALQGSQWLTGTIQVIHTPYSSLTRDTITGKLEVNVGLSSANVTLLGKLSGLDSSTKGLSGRQQQQQDIIKSVDYNERFKWDHPDKMYKEHIEALRKGLPYPILTVTEFLSQDSEGFNWTRQLRQAGFYSSLALYTALASWCLMTIVICILPIYLPHMMQITGAFMMSSVWIYTLLIQSPKSFAFQLGGNRIEFAFGYTYVTTFIAGAMSMFAGVLLFAIQMNNPHKQFTIMDSEQFVNDQKALYNNNLAVQQQQSSSLQIDNYGKKNGQKFSNQKVLNRSDSVIIPIADIEKNFSQ